MSLNEGGFSLGNCVLRKETDKAFLFACEDFQKDVWVPKTQIHGDSELGQWSDSDDEGEVYVSGWFADKNGWT